ncbi:MAG: hypothetical protein ACFFC0_05305, partial [Promethearchaeota archaeon]
RGRDGPSSGPKLTDFDKPQGIFHQHVRLFIRQCPTIAYSDSSSLLKMFNLDSLSRNRNVYTTDTCTIGRGSVSLG